jgi:hypothetical protein
MSKTITMTLTKYNAEVKAAIEKAMKEFRQSEIDEKARIEREKRNMWLAARRRNRVVNLSQSENDPELVTFENCPTQIKFCPNACNDHGKMAKLELRLLSPTHAQKHCPICFGSFTFTRADTPEGRRLRGKEYRLKSKPEIAS